MNTNFNMSHDDTQCRRTEQNRTEQNAGFRTHLVCCSTRLTLCHKLLPVIQLPALYVSHSRQTTLGGTRFSRVLSVCQWWRRCWHQPINSSQCVSPLLNYIRTWTPPHLIRPRLPRNVWMNVFLPKLLKNFLKRVIKTNNTLELCVCVCVCGQYLPLAAAHVAADDWQLFTGQQRFHTLICGHFKYADVVLCVCEWWRITTHFLYSVYW